MLSRKRGTASLLRRKSASTTSRSTPMASSTVATVKPVLSLPAKQCVMTGRPAPSNEMTCRTARCAPAKRREALILLRHEPPGRDRDVLVVGLFGHHLLEGRLVRRLTIHRRHLVEVQMVHLHAAGTAPAPCRSTSRADRRSATSVMPKPSSAARPASSSPLSSLDRKNRPGRTPVSSAMSRKFHAPDRASGSASLRSSHRRGERATSRGRVRRGRWCACAPRRGRRTAASPGASRRAGPARCRR